MKNSLHASFVISAFASFVTGAGAAVTQVETFGGADTTNVANWTTSSVAFDDTVQSGHSMNWESVAVNTASVDTVNNEFDLAWQTSGSNYTIGHLFMYNESFTQGPILDLQMTADLEASAFANWSPVLGVTDRGTGVETFYRWNHSNNAWNGNGAHDFSVVGANDWDLSQLGNASNTNTAIWGELNSSAGNFGGTRDNGTNPDLQAVSPFDVNFGFIQWGASTGGNINTLTNFTTSIDSFEVAVTFAPEPSRALLLGMGIFAGLLRRRR